LAGTPVPAGTFFIAPGTPKPNTKIANTFTWFSDGRSSYNSLQVDLKRRFSHGLAIRGVYTWSKALVTYVRLPPPNQTVPVQSPAAGTIHEHVHHLKTGAIRAEISLVKPLM
jgi:hypothetical protein